MAESNPEGDSFVNDAWFAGFVDGEGSFVIAVDLVGRHYPIFSLELRADELPIIKRLQGEFGGSVRLRARQEQMVNAHPTYGWFVRNKPDLARLLSYFDRFPLRAKKRADYLIWRRAAVAYCEQGGRHPELAQLRSALMAGRAYGGPRVLLPEAPEPRQLRLGA